MDLLENKQPITMQLKRDKGNFSSLEFNTRIIPLCCGDGDGVIISICDSYLLALRKESNGKEKNLFKDLYLIKGRDVERIKTIKISEEDCSPSALFKLGQIY